MNFKYRVKGKVNQGFILRGKFNKCGDIIDICIYEKELNFIKNKCDCFSIEDYKEEEVVDNFSSPMPEIVVSQETEKKEPKKEKEQIDRTSNRSNKGKNKKQV